MFVAFDAVAVFWIASRIIYSLKIANHIQLATIEQQAGALAAANVRLARAEQFKTDLLAVAAHDIRDPLNTISLSAQYLRDEIPAGSPLRRVVLGIDDSARRLAEFVGNLLTDTTSDTQEIDLQLTAVNLPELVADIVSRFQPIAGAKDIALHFTAADSARHAPPASVDPARYRQIVENLVTNAIKYSPAHKNVWVELAHTPADGHRLTVRDEGPGLTPADQARLFRKYQRLSARPTAGENSTGLGLFIVKNLVTLHGGRVWAESKGGGGGAQFVVTVP
jgi:signal transduction histidine kinase